MKKDMTKNDTIQKIQEKTMKRANQNFILIMIKKTQWLKPIMDLRWTGRMDLR